MIAVLNASPIIALSLIGRFSILLGLFDDLYVPGGVSAEIVRDPARRNLEQTVRDTRVRHLKPGNELAVSALQQTLGRGESEAIVLAQEVRADFLVLDESRARAVAERLGLPVIGTIGLLKLYCDRTGELLQPLLAALRDTGFWISDAVMGPLSEGNARRGGDGSETTK